MLGTALNAPLSKGEHFADVNGLKLHYRVNGSGPVCLLPSPGWGAPVDLYQPLSTFENYFTMVYYDTRLSGLSTGPDDDSQYGVDQFVEDIEALRVYLGQEKIWLTGHSGGGHQVLSYGIKYGENLNGIISIDAIAAPDSFRAEQLGKLLLKKKELPFFKANPDYYEKALAFMFGQDKSPYTISEILGLMGRLYFHDPEKGAGLLEDLNYSDKAYKYSVKSGFQGKNLLPELSTITVPVLIISGDDDFICDSVSQAERIHDSIKSSTLAIVKDSGHMPWIEQPEQFATACESWFKAQQLKA